MRKTLEQYEAERGDDGDPFELELSDGEWVTLRHPEDMPFDDLLRFDSARPAEVLRVLMGEDAFTRLVSAVRPDGSKRVTLGVLGGILTDYMQHYGMGTPGEAVASPPSSIGSARRSKRTSPKRASA